MVRIKSLSWVFIVIVSITIITGFFLFHRQAENSMSMQVQDDTPALNMGIVYLPVTSKIANYYELKVNSGALVTQVIEGSLVDQAGIKVGDVIVSFNGVGVGETTPLLGMMRSCPIGHGIILGVWSDGNTREVTIMHPRQ